MTTKNCKSSRSSGKKSDQESMLDAWVLTSRREGDSIAGWKIDSLYRNCKRQLENSERCQVTSFCYPPGAKVIKAKLSRITVDSSIASK